MAPLDHRTIATVDKDEEMQGIESLVLASVYSVTKQASSKDTDNIGLDLFTLIAESKDTDNARYKVRLSGGKVDADHLSRFVWSVERI